MEMLTEQHHFHLSATTINSRFWRPNWALILSLLIPLCATNLASGSDLVVSDAELLPGESLCQLKRFPNEPEGYQTHEGTRVSVTMCGNLEKELKEPRAIRVSFKNSGQSDLEAVVDPAKITIRTGAEQTVALSALRANRLIQFGNTLDLYWTDITGQVSISVGGGKEADWIFIFTGASKGDTLQMDKYGEIIIR
jgi:hypothetical protein